MNAVTRLNNIYSQVKIGGKVRIWDGNDFLSQNDFVALEAGNGTWEEAGKGRKFIADTAIWLSSPNRNLFRHCTFYPGPVPDDTFNLWTDWNICPKQGDYPLFRQHLMDNICSGRKDYAKWLWQWLAQLVREPWIKTGTAVVLRGLKGTGKSALADVVGKLCGQSYTSISHGEQALGRFNSTYERALLVCFEEAVWAGNKKGESVLKNLITCTRLLIERKGLEPYNVPNFTRIIMVANADWIVPATWDERRFFVLDVQDHWKNDTGKFSAMFSQMDDGGYSALMYDLLMNTRIDPQINLRKPPMTQALSDQIVLSEPVHVQFFKSWIENQDMDEWQGDVWARELEDKMVLYCNGHRGYAPSWQTFMGDLVKRGVKYERKQLRRLDSKREVHIMFDLKSVLLDQNIRSINKMLYGK